MSRAAIQIDGLSKSFQGVPVLEGLGLELPAGQRIALVGPNGAGKTTLIRCLLGQYRCDGVVEILGRSPRRDRTRILGEVGFVPQLPPPLRMPVGQLLRFASRLCGADSAAIENDAARLGLEIPPLRRRAFAKLSGGQKQKLLIAIALRPGTRVLIMDEPAANLDPAARSVLFELLAERSEDATMVISSHRLDEVAALVERVVELDRGRIVLDQRIASGALDERLACRIELSRAEDSARDALLAWGFRARTGERVFVGSVAGPDRLRFFGMLARYAGLVEGVQLGGSPTPERERA